MGFSQGGQTSLWAAHVAEEYAPEFRIVGIAPIAPASRHLYLSFYDLDIPENSGYFISRMAGLQIGHPELSLRDILTEAGLELLTAQSWGCYEIFGAGAALAEPYARPEALEPGTPWRERLEENDEFLPIPDDIPVFMIQGDLDIDVPVELTREVTPIFANWAFNWNTWSWRESITWMRSHRRPFSCPPGSLIVSAARPRGTTAQNCPEPKVSRRRSALSGGRNSASDMKEPLRRIAEAHSCAWP